MRTLIILFLFIFTINSSQINAQCDKGIFTLEICLQAGTECDSIEYEVLCVDVQEYSSNYTSIKKSKKLRDEQFFMNTKGGIMIDEELAEDITERKDKWDEYFFENAAKEIGFKQKGYISDGKLEILTCEKCDVMHIIKITFEGKNYYILGNFFGGCDRTSILFYIDGDFFIGKQR